MLATFMVLAASCSEVRAQLTDPTIGMEITERLATSDPSNADWQRDLIIGLASMNELTGDRSYAARALDVALRMRSLGILAPADEWMIEELRRLAGR